MRYILHPVAPVLRPYVRALWTLDSRGSSWTETVPASLHQDLVVGATRYGVVVGGRLETVGEARVHGITVAPHEYLHSGADRLTGVHFHPGGLGAFTTDLRRFTDQVATKLQGQRWSEPCAAFRAAALEAWLRTQLRPEEESMLPILAALGRSTTVAAAAKELGTSPRTLHRRCVRRLGMGPKQVLRLARLHRAQRMLENGRSLAEAAVASGYADQPHLCREWRALTGKTPTGR